MKTILLILIVISNCFAKSIMPWMCLDACGENVQADLQQINQYDNVLTAVAYESFTVSNNSEFISFNYSQVGPQLQQMNLQTWPMITTFDLGTMRSLFNDPQDFIIKAVQVGSQFAFTGYNIDFEPNGDADDDDAQNFAGFLTTFANALHESKMLLSVCVADWSPFWNFTYIGDSTVDQIITMDTYATPFSEYQYGFMLAVNNIPANKLSIGLIDDPSGENFTTAELELRFNMISKYNIQSIALWDTPIPANYLPFLENFITEI